MAELVQRPRYYEGQIVAAADLTAGLEYARAKEARHDRLVHKWGIADGLALVGTPQQSATGQYLAVALQPGVAIDGSGREVLVPQATPLDEKLFLRSNVAVGDAEAWYPVMLAGADRPALPTALTRSCAVTQANRTVESWQLSFGAPGDERKLAAQSAPAVWSGAGGKVEDRRWWLLLGFVQWDATQQRFVAVSAAANGVARRYVGVRADEVAAQGGDLVLRSQPDRNKGAAVVTVHSEKGGGRVSLDLDDGQGGHLPTVAAYADGTIETHGGQLVLRCGPAATLGKPMLELDETTGGGTLTFGLQQANSRPSSLLAVDEQGNLSIAGVFKGLVAGGVRLESGTASHGALLPLPNGITDAQVADGTVLLHFQLTPVALGTAPWDADLASHPVWLAHLQEASVDPVTRALTCLVRWVGLPSGAHPLVTQTVASACDYVVFAVPQEKP
jgi:hypothetical protein